MKIRKKLYTLTAGTLLATIPTMANAAINCDSFAVKLLPNNYPECVCKGDWFGARVCVPATSETPTVPTTPTTVPTIPTTLTPEQQKLKDALTKYCVPHSDANCDSIEIAKYEDGICVCQSGYVWTPSSRKCLDTLECPSEKGMQYGREKYDENQTCPEGTAFLTKYYTNQDGIQEPYYICEPCPAGTYLLNGFCYNCPAGTYNPYNAQTSCTPCPSGFTVNNMTGAKSINSCFSVCSSGYYPSNNTYTECKDIKIGNKCNFLWWDCYDIYERSCKEVSTGIGAPHCNECPDGSYCPDGITKKTCDKPVVVDHGTYQKQVPYGENFCSYCSLQEIGTFNCSCPEEAGDQCGCGDSLKNYEEHARQVRENHLSTCYLVGGGIRGSYECSDVNPIILTCNKTDGSVRIKGR